MLQAPLDLNSAVAAGKSLKTFIESNSIEVGILRQINFVDLVTEFSKKKE